MRRLRFFDYLHDENGSVTRARSEEGHVAELEEGGPWAVLFEDSETIHEVELVKVNGEWHGDCWDLEDGTGDRVQRCRGFAFHDGPCAHLYLVWNRLGRGEVEIEAPRHARARADGGFPEHIAGIDGQEFGRPEGQL